MNARKLAGIGVAAAMVLVLSGAANANLLNLTKMYPDVYTDSIQVTYDQPSGILWASGFPNSLNDGLNENDGLTNWANDGDFYIQVHVDAAGHASGGQMLIQGVLNDDGVEQTLFQSDKLISFGSGAEDKFEFVFLQQSGLEAPAGMAVGVILDGREITAFHTPVYGASFSNSGTGYADAFASPGSAPEPVSLSLLALAALGLASPAYLEQTFPPQRSLRV